MDVRVALVTGASRGIGKACAIALARAGYDVAIAARTVKPGEIRDNTITVHRSDARPLPGSLEETAAVIHDAGRRSLILPMDLLDRAAVGSGMTTVLERWGRVDLLLHNGRYIGPGMMDRILDTPIDAFEKFFEAHVMAQLILTRMALPGMLARRSGIIMTMGSGAAYNDPPAAAGEGGWGLAYAIGKAGGMRLVGHVKAEFGDLGIRSFNVDPGYVSTERNQAIDDGHDHAAGASPDVVGAAVAWLATSPDAVELDGTNVHAQESLPAAQPRRTRMTVKAVGAKVPRIAPSAWVSEAAYVVGDVEVGANSSIWPGAVVRADLAPVVIGSNTHIEDNCVLHTGIPLTVGDNVLVGHAAVLHCRRIGHNCLIGNHATVLDGATVGDFTMVAAGAVLLGGTVVPPESFVVGMPATVRAITPAQLARLRAQQSGDSGYGPLMREYRAAGL